MLNNSYQHLFDMAPIIFNDRLQSALESFTGVMHYILGDYVPFLSKFQLQLVHQIRGCSVDSAL